MGRLGLDCGKDMYYDLGTSSCAYCSQLCHLVDIQGTREECEDKCPGYLTTITTPTTTTTTSSWELTATLDRTTSPPLSDSPLFIAVLSVLCIGVIVAVGLILYKNRERLIKRLKRQDCCGDGKSTQPHVQETGRGVSQPEQHGLLENREGFRDMPHTSLTPNSGFDAMRLSTV